MMRVDEINASMGKLDAKDESAGKAERTYVLAKMKPDIKLYSFETSDFKFTLLTRIKLVQNKVRAVANSTAKKSAEYSTRAL